MAIKLTFDVKDTDDAQVLLSAEQMRFRIEAFAEQMMREAAERANSKQNFEDPQNAAKEVAVQFNEFFVSVPSWRKLRVQ